MKLAYDTTLRKRDKKVEAPVKVDNKDIDEEELNADLIQYDDNLMSCLLKSYKKKLNWIRLVPNLNKRDYYIQINSNGFYFNYSSETLELRVRDNGKEVVFVQSSQNCLRNVKILDDNDYTILNNLKDIIINDSKLESDNHYYANNPKKALKDIINSNGSNI